MSEQPVAGEDAAAARGGRRQGRLAEPSLTELTVEECLSLLRSSEIGRVAVVTEDGFPVVLPVNHLVVETEKGTVVIYLRTRPGNVIDTAPDAVAFQVDRFDAVRHEGWSVLVRGRLRHAAPVHDAAGEQLTAAGWLADRDSLILIEPIAITGRRLSEPEFDWPFHPRAYL
jgi:uncharacterized protein